MVNVTHNGNNRRSVFQVFFVVLKEFQTFLYLFFLNFADGYAQSQVFCQYHNGVFINVLVDICHDTQFHQSHDNFGCGDFCLFTEACNGNRHVNYNSAFR